ncbi:MAG: NADH-quinone oxidoreductase subunit NuoK [Terriglobia bacterium]
MTSVPVAQGLILAGILFALGVIGLLVRRNLLFILMSLEVMVNASGLAFVVAGSRWGQPDGQVMFIFILAMAAAEVSVGLALLLQLYQRYRTLDVDVMSQMRG